MPPSTKLELPASHPQLTVLTHMYRTAGTQANLHPKDAGAWADLATVALETGQAERALELSAEATRLAANEPRFHYLNGRAARALGQLPEAINSYRRAISLKSDYVDAWVSLGLVHRARYDFPAASEALRRALQLAPKRIDVLLNLGNVFFDRAQWQLAAESFGKVCQQEPLNQRALYGTGRALFQLNRLDQAAIFLRPFAELQPLNFSGVVTLSKVESLLGNTARAQEVIDIAWQHVEALALQGGDAAHQGFTLLSGSDCREHNLVRAQELAARNPEQIAWRLLEGYALADSFQIAQAEALAKDLLVRAPRDVSVFVMASYVASLAGKPEWADEVCTAGEAVAAENPVAILNNNHGLMLLMLGRYAEGLPYWEWRFRMKDRPHDNQSAVRARELWDGSDLNGKRLFIWCEQGLGDTLQMARFLPILRRMGARTMYGIPPGLERLFTTSLIVENTPVLSEEPAYDEYDFHIPDCSLMHRLGVTLDNIPQAPYIKPAEEFVSAWAERMPARQGLRVGLVWAGNPQQPADMIRSVPPQTLAALQGLENVQWFSLQKGNPAPEFRGLPPLELIDLTDHINDFADTAGLLAHLDLLISVDTSVVHLAGAMGKPVWLLNRASSEWRWMMERNDSVWYPSVRIFRQQQLREWGPLLQEVADALVPYAAAGSTSV